MSNKRQETSDKKHRGQKGFTILISLFLFILLAIFALNMAEIIAVDTRIVPTNVAQNITGMGPQKENERLQVWYLAQGGIHHMHRMLVDIQRCLPGNCTLSGNNLYAGSKNYDDGVATNRTGQLWNWLGDSTASSDLNHTPVQNLNSSAEAYAPDESTYRTVIRAEQDLWRSSRIYGQNLTAAAVANNNPVNLIDTSGTATTYAAQTDGFGKDMGTRASPVTTALNLGARSFSIASCSGVIAPPQLPGCKAVIEFGMQVDFDEIRWLNRKDNYVEYAKVTYWNDTTGSWTDPGAGSGNYFTFPVPATGTAYAPYYETALACKNDGVYNGDRCSDFLNADGDGPPNNIWEALVGGVNSCAATGCSGLPSAGPSYIARLKLNTPVRTRKIELRFDAHVVTTPFVFEELGVFCCGSNPANIRNVLVDLHGVVRTGVAYTYDPLSGNPPILTYPNLNSSYIGTEGDLHIEKTYTLKTFE